MNITEHRVLGDHRGQLVAIEGQQDVPFEVKRVFYIYGTQPGVPRGQHSHHQTRQYLIAVNGSCKVTLDDGTQKVTYDLNHPISVCFKMRWSGAQCTTLPLTVCCLCWPANTMTKLTIFVTMMIFSR